MKAKGRKSIFIIMICLWKPSTQPSGWTNIYKQLKRNFSTPNSDLKEFQTILLSPQAIYWISRLNATILFSTMEKSFFMLQFSKKKSLQCRFRHVTTEWVTVCDNLHFPFNSHEGNSKCGKRVLNHLENEWTWMGIKAIPARVASDLLDLENLGRLSAESARDLGTWRSIILPHNYLQSSKVL